MPTYLRHKPTGYIVQLIATNGLVVKVRHDAEDGTSEGHAPAHQFTPIDPTPWLPALLASLEAQEGANHRASLR